ncbi:MAG TPA: MotE family protein [Pararhizobium sp.]|nr:MotE family protein [Pararhizobium sp.]
MTEGGAASRPTSALASRRDALTLLCPAGHLSRKGGDRQEPGSIAKAGVAVAALLICFSVVVASGSPAHAQDSKTDTAPTDAISKDIETYCTNIADAARDRRYLMQKKEIAALQTGIDKRMKELDQRQAEYEDWLTRRNDFLKAAKDGLVEIYTKMDSDAAARQLELMDPSIAAAIVMKLTPDKASGILNEMKAEKAATLAGIIAAAGNPNTSSRNPS